MRAAIADYFKFTLGRPEILNRIGDNIVVFDFIQPAVAERILDGMLANIVRRVADEHDLTLLIPDPVRRQLLEWCIQDLSDGGRGIGNRLETTFVNPLARALFHLEDDPTAGNHRRGDPAGGSCLQRGAGPAMSGPKCYRYTVDLARLRRQLEAERQQRELQQHQQAIERCRADLQTLTRALADLQTRYPGETIQLDLTPPAPPQRARWTPSDSIGKP